MKRLDAVTGQLYLQGRWNALML